MHSVRRSLAVASTLGILVAPLAARAETPSPGNTSVPACIRLVGSNGTTASASGEFTVVARDLANNPIPFAIVTVDLSNASDIRLCSDQLDADLTMDCAGPRASKFTDANGVVRFTLLGASDGPAMSLLNAGRIYLMGWLVGSPTVSAFDLDGASGLGANDLSQWLTDFGSGSPYGRSDYDCSGSVGANDLALWFAAFGSGTQAVSCAASCP